MEGAANPLDDPADAAALAGYAAALADAVVAALPSWVKRVIDDRYRAWSGEGPPSALEAAGRAAGAAVVAEVEGPLRAVLAQDVDEQRTNPLSVIRAAIHHPTAVLDAMGVPAVARDAHAERLFPDDVYDLAPAAFADLGPSVHEPGVVWGAAKAHVVLARRRRSAPPTSS